MDIDAVPIRPRLYHETHNGPYIIIVRELIVAIPIIKISKHLHTKYVSMISCQKLGSRLKLTLSNRDEANNLVADPILKDFDVRIPAADVEVYGIIHLPTHDDHSVLKIEAKGKFRHPDLPLIDILEAKRMWKNSDPNDLSQLKQEMPYVKVCFAGTILPDWIVSYL